MALTRNDCDTLSPVLLTSTNRPEYVLRPHRFAGLLPAVIPHVTYAERISR